LSEVQVVDIPLAFTPFIRIKRVVRFEKCVLQILNGEFLYADELAADPPT
jgi:hypothetical protein